MERRAVFATIPPLLSEILVEVVCREGTLTLIADFRKREDLAEHLPLLAPDVVLIGLNAGERDGIGAFALRLAPCARVLVLSHDVRDLSVHGFGMPPLVLADFSLPDLLAAIGEPRSILPG